MLNLKSNKGCLNSLIIQIALHVIDIFRIGYLLGDNVMKQLFYLAKHGIYIKCLYICVPNKISQIVKIIQVQFLGVLHGKGLVYTVEKLSSPPQQEKVNKISSPQKLFLLAL